jgi:hypothetical protein
MCGTWDSSLRDLTSVVVGIEVDEMDVYTGMLDVLDAGRRRHVRPLRHARRA